MNHKPAHLTSMTASAQRWATQRYTRAFQGAPSHGQKRIRPLRLLFRQQKSALAHIRQAHNTFVAVNVTTQTGRLSQTFHVNNAHIHQTHGQFGGTAKGKANQKRDSHRNSQSPLISEYRHNETAVNNKRSDQTVSTTLLSRPLHQLVRAIKKSWQAHNYQVRTVALRHRSDSVNVVSETIRREQKRTIAHRGKFGFSVESAMELLRENARIHSAPSTKIHNVMANKSIVEHNRSYQRRLMASTFFDNEYHTTGSVITHFRHKDTEIVKRRRRRLASLQSNLGIKRNHRQIQSNTLYNEYRTSGKAITGAGQVEEKPKQRLADLETHKVSNKRPMLTFRSSSSLSKLDDVEIKRSRRQIHYLDSPALVLNKPAAPVPVQAEIPTQKHIHAAEARPEIDIKKISRDVMKELSKVKRVELERRGML